MRPSYPNVTTLINRIARLNQRWADLKLKNVGIAGAAVPVLALLISGEAFTQAELVARIGTEQPTMALLLKRMERDGLIRRTAHPDDGRSAYLELTPQARKKIPTAKQILADGYATVSASFTQAELKQLEVLLERYLCNLEEMLDAPPKK